MRCFRWWDTTWWASVAAKTWNCQYSTSLSMAWSSLDPGSFL